MFTQNAVFFEWPFGPESEPTVRGKTVRFFDPIRPLHISQWGERWRVTDERKSNERGGPDVGVWFTTRAEAEDFVRSAT